MAGKCTKEQLERAAAYRNLHKEEIRLYKKAYREKNRDRLNEEGRAYRLQNLEKFRQRKLEWQRANPDMVRAAKARRRCPDGGGFTSKDVVALFEEQKGLCVYCKISLDSETYHVDHVIPLSRGGGNTKENIALACPSCNTSKGNKLFGYEWCICSKYAAVLVKRVSNSNVLDL